MRYSIGAMALEFVFKILILLVTAAVIIMLIVTFSTDIRGMVNRFVADIFGEPREQSIFPETIEKDSFIATEIATYIEGCLAYNEAIDESKQKDVVCYVLLAEDKFSSFKIGKTSILNSVEPSIRDRIEIQSDFSKSYLKIKFEDLGNKIIVE